MRKKLEDLYCQDNIIFFWIECFISIRTFFTSSWSSNNFFLFYSFYAWLRFKIYYLSFFIYFIRYVKCFIFSTSSFIASLFMCSIYCSVNTVQMLIKILFFSDSLNFKRLFKFLFYIIN